MVRWLSLIDLLESLVKSYTQTKKVLFTGRQHGKLNRIDEYELKQLFCLLGPFKHVLRLIQTRGSPSLFTVLPCTLSLKKVLSSFDELFKYQSAATNGKNKENEEDNDEEPELLVESEGKYRVISKIYNNCF